MSKISNSTNGKLAFEMTTMSPNSSEICPDKPVSQTAQALMGNGSMVAGAFGQLGEPPSKKTILSTPVPTLDRSKEEDAILGLLELSSAPAVSSSNSSNHDPDYHVKPGMPIQSVGGEGSTSSKKISAPSTTVGGNGWPSHLRVPVAPTRTASVNISPKQKHDLPPIENVTSFPPQIQNVGRDQFNTDARTADLHRINESREIPANHELIANKEIVKEKKPRQRKPRNKTDNENGETTPKKRKRKTKAENAETTEPSNKSEVSRAIQPGPTAPSIMSLSSQISTSQRQFMTHQNQILESKGFHTLPTSLHLPMSAESIAQNSTTVSHVLPPMGAGALVHTQHNRLTIPVTANNMPILSTQLSSENQKTLKPNKSTSNYAPSSKEEMREMKKNIFNGIFPTGITMPNLDQAHHKDTLALIQQQLLQKSSVYNRPVPDKQLPEQKQAEEQPLDLKVRSPVEKNKEKVISAPKPPITLPYPQTLNKSPLSSTKPTDRMEGVSNISRSITAIPPYNMGIPHWNLQQSALSLISMTEPGSPSALQAALRSLPVQYPALLGATMPKPIVIAPDSNSPISTSTPQSNQNSPKVQTPITESLTPRGSPNENQPSAQNSATIQSNSAEAQKRKKEMAHLPPKKRKFIAYEEEPTSKPSTPQVQPVTPSPKSTVPQTVIPTPKLTLPPSPYMGMLPGSPALPFGIPVPQMSPGIGTLLPGGHPMYVLMSPQPDANKLPLHIPKEVERRTPSPSPPPFDKPEEYNWAVQPDEDGDLPLHIAVAQNDVEAVRKLITIMKRLRYHRGLDTYNKLRQTPLHLAVIVRSPELVSLLCNSGANPNIRDRKGQNCLQLCVIYNTIECLHKILQCSRNKLEFDSQNFEGLTPLHVAVINGKENFVNSLLEAGADINIQDGKSGRTPIHHAAENNLYRMASVLLQKGANVEINNFSGVTPAQSANGRNYGEMLSLLVKYGADAGANKEALKDVDSGRFKHKDAVKDRLLSHVRNQVQSSQQRLIGNPEVALPADQTLAKDNMSGGEVVASTPEKEEPPPLTPSAPPSRPPSTPH